MTGTKNASTATGQKNSGKLTGKYALIPAGVKPRRLAGAKTEASVRIDRGTSNTDIHYLFSS